MSLKDAWEAEANNWVAWARKPGHDSYWRFHRDRFLELWPPPPRAVLDMGCGEGRLRLVEVADSSEPPGSRWQRIPLLLQLRALKA